MNIKSYIGVAMLAAMTLMIGTGPTLAVSPYELVIPAPSIELVQYHETDVANVLAADHDAAMLVQLAALDDPAGAGVLPYSFGLATSPGLDDGVMPTYPPRVVLPG